jgi:hypothetical protein
MIRSFTLLLLLVVAASLQAQPDTWERVKPARDVIPPGDVQRQFTDPIRVGQIVPSEWRCLEQARVRDELKLTAMQKQTLDALSRPDLLEAALPLLWSSYVTAETVREWLPSARDAFLNSTLTKEQQVRLRQVVYQLKEREFGAHAAFAMAAKDLGLGTDQLEDVTSIKGQRVEEIAKLVTSGERFEKVKKQVEAANGDTFEKMTEMLTRAQREKLKEVKGKAFEGKVDFAAVAWNVSDSPRYPRELFGYYDLELFYLYEDHDLRKELKLTPKQALETYKHLQLWSMAADWYARTATPKDIARAHDSTAEALKTILSKEQQTRLHQIMMQRRERASPEAMCGHPVAVAALKLSPLQLQKLSEGKNVVDVLSREQRDARLALLGEPFALDLFVSDYLVSSPPGKASTALFFSYARHFLVNSERLRLSEEQLKKLRELAEDEPKFFELIRRELSFSDTPPVIGAARSQTSGAAVAERYRAAAEEQCFAVLDEKQQSLAKQIFGRRR